MKNPWDDMINAIKKHINNVQYDNLLIQKFYEKGERHILDIVELYTNKYTDLLKTTYNVGYVDGMKAQAFHEELCREEKSMTNAEKFKEVFGMTPNKDSCPIFSSKICSEQLKKHFNDPCEDCCKDCPFEDWWNKEYRPCFKIKEDLDE